MKNSRYIHLLIFLLLSIIGCDDDPPTDSHTHPINPYLKEIKFSNPNKSGNFYMAAWKGNTIFSVLPLAKFNIDNDFNLVKDTILEANISSNSWSYIDANSSGSKLLLVEMYFGGVSAGALYEYDVPTGQLQLIYDNTYNIASARYYPNDEDKIVYYTFGKNPDKNPGYYLFNKTSQQDTLIFSYSSTAGVWETLHGFDIHPNGDTILVPISQGIGQFDHSRPPKLGIASLKTQKLDTLNIDFDFSFLRSGLWVRYNHDGSKILYCCFPFNAYGFVTNDNSEIGIIESATLTKTILDVNTNSESEYGSVQLAPNWSPDENGIVFGSGQVIYTGQAGTRHLYILTKIN